MAQLADAQLSAIAAGVDDTIARVAELAQDLSERHEADAATALYEAERSLAVAGRALARARASLER